MGNPRFRLCLHSDACACVACGALASIVLLLIRASLLPVCEDCPASFWRIRGNICRECGVPIDAVSGDDDAEGSGELFDDVCLGWRSEKFHFSDFSAA